jgi:hypothetical protein
MNQIIILFKGFQKVGEFQTLEMAKNAMHENSTSGLSVFNFLFCEKIEGSYKVLVRNSEVVKK